MIFHQNEYTNWVLYHIPDATMPEGWFPCRIGTLVGTFEVLNDDEHRHKYNSSMAELLDTLGEDYCDESTGSVEWSEYVQRFGKRLLFTDDRGFVDCEKYGSVEEAVLMFTKNADAYADWCRYQEGDE